MINPFGSTHLLLLVCSIKMNTVHKINTTVYAAPKGQKYDTVQKPKSFKPELNLTPCINMQILCWTSEHNEHSQTQSPLISCFLPSLFSLQLVEFQAILQARISHKLNKLSLSMTMHEESLFFCVCR